MRGVSVYDSAGRELGASQVAGKYAVKQVAICRAVNPIPGLLLPPLAMHLLTPVFPALKRTVPRNLANLGFIGVALQLGLPTTIALFPQTASLPASELEPQFHDLRDEQGRRIEKVYFNKGL